MTTVETSTPAGMRKAHVVVAERPRGGVVVEVPFDPAAAWGELEAYHVHGTLGRQPYRGELVEEGGRWRLELGPSWCRAPGFASGDEVELTMAPEGPRSTSMGDDVAAAFKTEPEAARFFDSMPSFYRKDAARRLEAAKRPETRARRIAEIVEAARRRQREL